MEGQSVTFTKRFKGEHGNRMEEIILTLRMSPEDSVPETIDKAGQLVDEAFQRRRDAEMLYGTNDEVPF